VDVARQETVHRIVVSSLVVPRVFVNTGETSDIPKDRKADVDEQIGAAAGHHIHSDWRDWFSKLVSRS